MTDPAGRKAHTSSGIALMATGVVMAALCGVCTWGVARSDEVIAVLFFVGFIPVGVGLFLFALGLRQFLERGR